MKTTVKTKKWLIAYGSARALTMATAAVALLTAAVPNIWPHGDPNPNIAPVNSKPHGKSYSQWAAAWWQWAYSIPASANPLLDTTGENSDEGQKGPVWFLAGNLGGASEREVFVPEGKSLFFPVFNAPWVQFPTDPPLTIPEIRAISKTLTDNAILFCEIDGRTVRNLANYREESPVFTTRVSEDNILGLPAGDYAPSLDNGYYLMVNPLTPGQHSIHFKAESADHTFSLEVSYIVNVGKPPKVVPPDHQYQGKCYSEWSAQWWQWNLEHPLTGHPGIDSPEFDVRSGQQGNVWFLGGPLETHERSVTIPAGKALFVAIINAEASSLEDPPFHGDTEPEQRAAAIIAANHIVTVFCTIDNDEIQNMDDFRISSPQISFAAPTPWIFGATGGEGTAVGDGYQIMLRPLPHGQHKLHFGGLFRFTLADDGFDSDITVR
jgi:hypothetical protein